MPVNLLKYLPFSASTIVGLRNWHGTERELVDEAGKVTLSTKCRITFNCSNDLRVNLGELAVEERYRRLDG